MKDIYIFKLLKKVGNGRYANMRKEIKRQISDGIVLLDADVELQFVGKKRGLFMPKIEFLEDKS